MLATSLVGKLSVELQYKPEENYFRGCRRNVKIKSVAVTQNLHTQIAC